MPQGFSTVTAIDLALSWLILSLLLGLALRAMFLFHHHSDHPLPRLRISR
jgi:ribonuclease BN (tRNA processing enzyme)